jgi:hypothetical protein
MIGTWTYEFFKGFLCLLTVNASEKRTMQDLQLTRGNTVQLVQSALNGGQTDKKIFVL